MEKIQEIFDYINKQNDTIKKYGIKLLLVNDKDFENYIKQEERIKELETRIELLSKENMETKKVISSVLSQLSTLRKTKKE